VLLGIDSSHADLIVDSRFTTREILMNGTSFDAFARRAVATVSRRASLSALGAAALGAIASPDRVEAGCGKKCNKRCQAQSPQCAAAVEFYCQGTGNHELCSFKCGQCCFYLRNCDPDEVAYSATCLVSCYP
jgi:hypothetical protein